MWIKSVRSRECKIYSELVKSCVHGHGTTNKVSP